MNGVVVLPTSSNGGTPHISKRALVQTDTPTGNPVQARKSVLVLPLLRYHLPLLISCRGRGRVDTLVAIGLLLLFFCCAARVTRTTLSTNKKRTTTGEAAATLALFFPDAGSAALAKFDWGVGTENAQVRKINNYEGK